MLTRRWQHALMPVPMRDSGFDLDKSHLLSGIGGPVAQSLLDISSATRIAGPTPVPPASWSEAELDSFRLRCRILRSEAKAQLEKAMVRSSAMACARVAILLGQFDLHLRATTPSPNAFSYEIELITASRSGLLWTEKLGRGNIEAALTALVEARKFNVYSHLIQFTQGLEKAIGQRFSFDISLGKFLSVEWLSGRGKFFTAYDLRYLDAIKDDLALHGIQVPNPRAAHALVGLFIPLWAEAVQNLADLTPRDGVIQRILSSQSLLTHDPFDLSLLEKQALRTVNNRLTLTATKIRSSIPGKFRQDAGAWLDVLTLGSTEIGQAEIHSFMDSPLRKRPILVAGEQHLLALPHKLSTDLSTVVDGLWSFEHKENYFAARARSVEVLALRVLADRLPGCQSLGGGIYSSRDGRIRGEVDGIVVWHDICLILEGKGGFLSIASRRGSDEAVIADLRQTLGEGYFQAARLARVLEVDGSVELYAATGESLVIRERSLRRLYVVVPTADDFTVVATNLPVLWSKGILPSKSFPLIISAQDLMVLMDALASPVNIIAYLDFREEVLANSWIYLADEMEILGAFVGGLDLVGESRIGLAERSADVRFDHKRAVKRMHVAPVQQERHIDPWIAAKFGKSEDGDDRVQPPPRHDYRSGKLLAEFWKRKQDLASVAAGICLARGLPGLIVEGCAGLAGRGIRIQRHNGISAVAFPHNMSLVRVKMDSEVKKAFELSRYVLYVEMKYGTPSLSLITYGKKHARFKSENVRVALRSGIPLHDGWYLKMEAKRSKAFDRPTASALEAEGLSRDLAVGVARAGIAERVRATSEAGASLSKAAALWMGDLAQLATELHLGVTELEIVDTQLVKVISMVGDGVIPKNRVLDLLRLLVNSSQADPYLVACSSNLLANNDVEKIWEAVLRVLSEEPEAVRSLRKGKSATRNFLVGRVARAMERVPRADLVLRILDEAIMREHL